MCDKKRERRRRRTDEGKGGGALGGKRREGLKGNPKKGGPNSVTKTNGGG